MPDTKTSVKAPPEQIAYANLLFLGAWAGILLMFLTYFIYATGIMSPHVPMETIIQNWDKGVSEYLHITDSPHGWGWVSMLNKGDFLNYLGMVLLAIMTIICYLSTLLPAYLKRKERVYLVICILEVVVLSAAASGFLGSGGH